MAKRIKVLKCPQCGSGDVEEIRPDFFRCKSCSSEFFIDSDDININHYIYDKTATAPRTDNKNTLVGIIFGIVFLGLFITFGLFSGSKKNSGIKGPDWASCYIYFMESPDYKPVYIAVGKRSSHTSKNDNDPLFIGFYDALTKKEIKIVELPVKVDRLEVRFKELTDGNLYFAVNSKILFQVDKQSKSAVEFSENVYKNIPGLESGIAKIDMPTNTYEDVFTITNNEGQQVYYYPSTSKTYIGYDAFSKAKENYPAAADTISIAATHFLFTADDNRTKAYLLKYVQKFEPNYPQPYISIGWDHHEDYQEGSTIIDSSQGKYLGIKKDNKKEAAISSIVNFTPGRFYFSNAAVLDQTDKILLIGFKTTPAEDEKHTIQTLDAQTGKVLWTFHVTDDSQMYYPSQGKITKEGVFINFGREGAFFDTTGKLVSEFSFRF